MGRGRPRKYNDKEKWCNCCKAWLPLDDFGFNKTEASGRQFRCRKCANTYVSATKTRREYSLQYRLDTIYNISIGEYNALLSTQKGLCAICNDPLGATPYIDHHHGTGKVRGLLCKSCNTGIGMFREIPELFLKARSYILTNELQVEDVNFDTA